MFNVLVDCGLRLSPVTLVLSVGAIHEYVDVIVLVSGMLTVELVQILAVDALVIAGFGFTLIVAVVDDEQPFAVAVIVKIVVF